MVGESLTAWLDLNVAPGEGQAVWINTYEQRTDSSCAVVIPRDLNAPVPVRLDISFRLQPGAQTSTVESMSARLTAPTQGGVEIKRAWQWLWELQRLETLLDLGRAGIAAHDREKLEITLGLKCESPVAAAVAATVLLRSGELGCLHDWPRNLANWYGWLPDGPLLWAETLLRRYDDEQMLRLRGVRREARPAPRETPQDDSELVFKRAQEPAYKEAREFFARLGQSGPPLLAPSLIMAVRQLPFWHRLLEIGALSSAESEALKSACAAVEGASRYAVSGGLFAGFVAAEGSLSPEKVLGARARQATAGQRGQIPVYRSAD